MITQYTHAVAVANNTNCTPRRPGSLSVYLSVSPLDLLYLLILPAPPDLRNRNRETSQSLVLLLFPPWFIYLHVLPFPCLFVFKTDNHFLGTGLKSYCSDDFVTHDHMGTEMILFSFRRRLFVFLFPFTSEWFLIFMALFFMSWRKNRAAKGKSKQTTYSVVLPVCQAMRDLKWLISVSHVPPDAAHNPFGVIRRIAVVLWLVCRNENPSLSPLEMNNAAQWANLNWNSSSLWIYLCVKRENKSQTLRLQSSIIWPAWLLPSTTQVATERHLISSPAACHVFMWREKRQEKEKNAAHIGVYLFGRGFISRVTCNRRVIFRPSSIVFCERNKSQYVTITTPLKLLVTITTAT